MLHKQWIDDLAYEWFKEASKENPNVVELGYFLRKSKVSTFWLRLATNGFVWVAWVLICEILRRRYGLMNEIWELLICLVPFLVLCGIVIYHEVKGAYIGTMLPNIPELEAVMETLTYIKNSGIQRVYCCEAVGRFEEAQERAKENNEKLKPDKEKLLKIQDGRFMKQLCNDDIFSWVYEVVKKVIDRTIKEIDELCTVQMIQCEKCEKERRL